MTKDEALKMALEFIERVNRDGWILADFEPQMYATITVLKEALAQPEQTNIERHEANVQKFLGAPQPEPVTIWYMRDNHTFKKLSADVSIALIEIEQEFNEGHTYGMLCSKRKGFPNVHASGEKKRLEFFAECKKTLEEWLPNTTPPQRTWRGLTQEEFDKLIDDAGFTRSDKLMIGACIEQVIELFETKLKELNT